MVLGDGIFTEEYWAHLRQGEDCGDHTQSYTTQSFTALWASQVVMQVPFAARKASSAFGPPRQHHSGVVIAFCWQAYQRCSSPVLPSPQLPNSLAHYHQMSKTEIKFDGAFSSSCLPSCLVWFYSPTYKAPITQVKGAFSKIYIWTGRPPY